MARATRTLRRKLRREASTLAQVMLTEEILAELVTEDYECGKAEALPDPSRITASQEALAEVYLRLAVATQGTARRRWLRAAKLTTKGLWRPIRPAKLPPTEIQETL